MKRGMLGFVPALLALLAALAVAAWAQGDNKEGSTTSAAGGSSAPPAAASGGFATQTSDQFGISVALPSGGTLLTPQSPDWPWQSVPEMAYHWYGGNSGVKEVLVHVYTFQLPVTQATFTDFTGALKDDFQSMDKQEADEMAKDKTASLKQAIGVEKPKVHFKLGDDQGKINARWELGGNVWNHLAVKDMRNDKQPVNYSILSTFYGNKVYSITLIYLTDLNPQVKSFAEQVMGSFKVAGATAPLGVEQAMPAEAPGGSTPGGGSTMPPGVSSPSKPSTPAGHA
jgi:hypothetical protein